MPTIKSYVASAPWIFLGRGQVGEGTTYSKALRELGFLEEEQVVQYIQGYIVARKLDGLMGTWSEKDFEDKSVDWCRMEALNKSVNWKVTIRFTLLKDHYGVNVFKISLWPQCRD